MIGDHLLIIAFLGWHAGDEATQKDWIRTWAEESWDSWWEEELERKPESWA